MKSEYKFPYTIAIVPFFLILALATLWFFVVIPPHSADIPIRFNFANQPEWYVHRIIFVALFLLIELIVAGSILFSAHYWDNRLDHLQQELSTTNASVFDQIDNYRKSKNTASLINLFFFFLLILILFNYSLFYYQLKHIINPVPVAIIAVILVIGDLIFTLSTIRNKEKYISDPVIKTMKDKQPDISGEHWIGGIIYYNEDDHRFFVPKRSGLGLTINHARKGLSFLVYLVLSLIIFFAVYR
ncbi:MAG TPA: DUF5808 domain-containing protein [Balneolales bacterium]|nr:DUF5808 domain-containing protein [Balneolales bacterium]